MVHREVCKWTTARFAQWFCERSVMANHPPSTTHIIPVIVPLSPSLLALACERRKVVGWREKKVSQLRSEERNRCGTVDPRGGDKFLVLWD